MTIADMLKILNLSADAFSCEMENIKTKLESYVDELYLFNSAFDLVGAQSKDKIITHHIFDSLNAFEVIKNKAREIQQKKQKNISIADVGSGAGLPGIPLAICMPEFQFFLVERMSKRCSFLENCIAILGLKNVSVINTEIEKLSKLNDYDPFDLITFRAFRPLNEQIITSLFSILSKSGILAAYKAKKQNIEEEMANIQKIAPLYEIIPLSTSALNTNEKHERNLVFIPRFVE
ncbi:MAG: 16S rRNA (guanine(527)-N(7))-methyltransferase RsmG [Treponemataceae bacterium]